MTIIDVNSPLNWSIDSMHSGTKSQQDIFIETDKQILKYIGNAKDLEEPKQNFEKAEKH